MRNLVALISFSLASGCSTVPSHPDPIPVVAVAYKAAQFFDFEGRWPDSPAELCNWAPEFVSDVLSDDVSPSDRSVSAPEPLGNAPCREQPFTLLTNLDFQMVDGTFVIAFSREFNSRTEHWLGFTTFVNRQVSVDLRR